MKWWKLYFWFYIAVTLLGVLTFLSASYYGFIRPLALGDWFVFPYSVVGGIGLYSYVFKKRVFNSKFWKILLWIIIANLVFGILLSGTPLKESIQLPEFLKSSLPETKYFLSELLEFIAMLPTYYAIYKLGYRKSNKK